MSSIVTDKDTRGGVRMGRKQLSLNRSKTWQCPFFRYDGPEDVSCEGGRFRMPDKATANAYMDAYCAGRWKSCSIAAALLEYYDREDEHGKTNA